MPDNDLILHVKGTEDETTTLPKQVVRAAIAEGKLSRSQLIWSVPHNAWKQVRELPHLWPSQKLAPAPTPRVATGTLPRVVATGALPRVVADPPQTTASQPKMAASPVQPRAVTSAQAEDYQVAEKPHFNLFKWLCIVLGTFIVGTFGLNYLLVDRPISSALGQTPYSHVTIFAHLGGFMQRDALEIHILGSGSLNESNLNDFLVALAHATPQTTHTYQRISLSSGLQGQYTISGLVWKDFGDMEQASATERKEFLLDQLDDSSGHSLLNLNSTMTSQEQEAAREKVWAALVDYFTHS